MEFKIIDLDLATKEDVLKALNENKKTALLMEKEIQKLKSIAASVSKKECVFQPVENCYDDTIDTTVEEDVQEEKDDLEGEITYYLERFSKASLQELIENREDILPSLESYNYQNIMLRLRLETLKTMKEISHMIQEVSSDSLEEIQYYGEELEYEKKKLEILNMPVKEVSQEKKHKKNRLVFATTQGGNIRVLEDIDKRIPREYYPKFQELFSSIVQGTFKNVRRFVASNNETAGFYEVKDHKVRVVFDRLGPNTYAVITAFMKKSDKDKGYIDFLKRVLSDYKANNQKVFKESCDSVEFMTLQKHYELELFNKLGQDSRKGIERVKVNDASRIASSSN